MKAAFTEWHGRIAPVFDVSRSILMVEMERPDNTSERSVGLPTESPSAKIIFLAEHEVDILVCGAIFRWVQGLAESTDIQVQPFVAGEIRDIVNAWIRGDLDHVNYSMPVPTVSVPTPTTQQTTQHITRRHIMPRGNGAGPEGVAPMTGRRAGYCTGNVRAGWQIPSPGRARGRGWGFHGFPRNYLTAKPPKMDISHKALQSEREVLLGQLEDIEQELTVLDAKDKK